MSSMGGEFTFPLAGAYHASKYAVESLSDALRAEVRAFGIRVVLIQPSVVHTELITASEQSLRGQPGSPYREMVDGFGERTRRQIERGTGVIEADRVARVIVRASLAGRPRARYKVGATARVMPALRRWLLTPAWDLIVGATLSAPARRLAP